MKTVTRYERLCIQEDNLKFLHQKVLELIETADRFFFREYGYSYPLRYRLVELKEQIEKDLSSVLLKKYLESLKGGKK
jgi:hypothetical protein